jgi:hypothetical protein
MMITPSGIKISYRGKSGAAADSLPVVVRIVGFATAEQDRQISREMVIPAGATVEENLPEGLYNVQLTLPSGRILQRNVKIDQDSNEAHEFLEDFAPSAGFSLQEASGRAGSEILAEAALASGTISESDYFTQQGSSTEPVSEMVKPLGTEQSLRQGPDRPQLAIGSGMGMSVTQKIPDTAGWTARPANEVRGKAALWRIRDTNDVPRSVETRIWARVELADGRVELASIPQPWFCTATGNFTPAEILVDPDRSEGAATAVAVQDSKLAGLLAYLDRGQAGAARPLLEDIEQQNLIEQTIFSKMSNSLAACAAAYVGLSVYPPNEREQWDNWLENCMRLFPGVPDAAIVHARRLLLRPDNSGSNEDAADALRKACAAGPPYFSAGVSLLREMLLLLSADHQDLGERVEDATALAARVDPTQIFTVVRFAPPS